MKFSLRETKEKILDNFKNNRNRSPCHTLASTALERSCSLLETKPLFNKENSAPGVDEIISEAIRAYSARLAICELQEANSKIPKACHAFLPTEIAKVIERPQENLDKCIASLNSETQSWTSYSNAKQNAFYICHALSASKRREETLNIIEEWIKSSAELGEQLLYAPQQAQALFKEVKTNIMQFWMDLYEHDAAKRQEIHELWSELKGDMEADIAGVMKHFREEMLRLQAQGSRATQENFELVQYAFNKASESISAIAVKQQEDAVAQVELYEYATALFQQGIIQAIGNATRGMANQQELMAENYQSLLQFGVALANMALQVHSGEARLAALETGLRTIHEETERRFANLQSTANQTENILENVRESAVALRDAFGSIADFLGSGWRRLGLYWKRDISVRSHTGELLP